MTTKRTNKETRRNRALVRFAIFDLGYLVAYLAHHLFEIVTSNSEVINSWFLTGTGYTSMNDYLFHWFNAGLGIVSSAVMLVAIFLFVISTFGWKSFLEFIAKA